MAGPPGMYQLSNFGVMDAEDPEAFEAALVRAAVGQLMLFSTVETAHTVSYQARPAGPADIVIIGVRAKGALRLNRADRVQTMSTGRVGFMSSLASSHVDHLALGETTGIVVPTALLSAQFGLISSGVGLVPDTVLTRAASSMWSRMLIDILRTEATNSHELVEVEGALLAMTRSILRQLAAEDLADRAAQARAAAAQIIERRHRDPEFTIDALADDLHVSRRQLFRYFSDAPESAGAALLRRRLVSAQETLIQLPPIDLESVAALAGFPDAAALRSQFRRRVGMSPSEFRQSSASRREELARLMLLTTEQELAPLAD